MIRRAVMHDQHAVVATLAELGVDPDAADDVSHSYLC